LFFHDPAPAGTAKLMNKRRAEQKTCFALVFYLQAELGA